MEIGTKRLLQDFRQPGLSSRLLVQSHQLVQTVAAAATSGPTRLLVQSRLLVQTVATAGPIRVGPAQAVTHRLGIT